MLRTRHLSCTHRTVTFFRIPPVLQQGKSGVTQQTRVVGLACQPAPVTLCSEHQPRIKPRRAHPRTHLPRRAAAGKIACPCPRRCPRPRPARARALSLSLCPNTHTPHHSPHLSAASVPLSLALGARCSRSCTGSCTKGGTRSGTTSVVAPARGGKISTPEPESRAPQSVSRSERANAAAAARLAMVGWCPSK